MGAKDNKILLIILAILLPPLAVYLKVSAINIHFWISLLLTLFFWLPGIIHALYTVLKQPPAPKDVLLIILCFILPPLAVYLIVKKCSDTFFIISIILCIFFWFPGVIFALYVFLSKEKKVFPS